MLGTRAAGGHHLCPQGLSRTEDSDTGIGRGESVRRGVVLHRNALHLEFVQDVGVLRFQRPSEAGHARTYLVGDLGRRHGLCQFQREPFEGTVRRGIPAMVIDHGIAQQPVEPGDRRLVVAQRVHVRNGTAEGLLEEVLSDIGVAGGAPQARRVATGVYEVRFPGNGAQVPMVSAPAAEATIGAVGPGTFRVGLWVPGRQDAVDTPFSVVAV